MTFGRWHRLQRINSMRVRRRGVAAMCPVNTRDSYPDDSCEKEEVAMATMTIAEFCDLHSACEAGRDWALAECQTMDDVWATARPEWLVWVATRPGVLCDRSLRLFAVFCARQVEHLLTDDRSRRAIAAAERFANGEATQEELAAAWDAAASAASDAAWADQAGLLRETSKPNFERR